MAYVTKFNFHNKELINLAIENEEGILNSSGVLCTYTGAITGRSPDAKYIVKDEITKDIVDWNNNQSMSTEEFGLFFEKFASFRNNRMVYSQDVRAVRDELFGIYIQVYTEYAKHSLFARNMFIPVPVSRIIIEKKWKLFHFPSISKEPIIAISFKKQTVLICGTLYAGEMKKSIFTVLNLNFLEHGLPMHCAVNVDKERKNPAIFFGLSGTGKTTLSADSSRTLIGDDEHGWSPKGITNFEGGCYAKTIDLSKEHEPQIWEASHTPGTMLENVVLIEGIPDFTDTKYTQNSRASYPTSSISGADDLGYVYEQPKNIVMLTCDAFGVLPAVVKLTTDEAVEQFLLGYTAKVAGTEKGVTEPKATFSPCFGLPFMPCPPKVYGNKLKELIDSCSVDCWLVNTGWSGGPYGTGTRMPISTTRKIIEMIHDGSLAECDTIKHQPTGFTVPVTENIDENHIHPEKSWSNRDEYNKKLSKLLRAFSRAGKAS